MRNRSVCFYCRCVVVAFNAAKGKVKSGRSKSQTLKEFKCERCNEAFGTFISLRRHKLSHGGELN